MRIFDNRARTNNSQAESPEMMDPTADSTPSTKPSTTRGRTEDESMVIDGAFGRGGKAEDSFTEEGGDNGIGVSGGARESKSTRASVRFVVGTFEKARGSPSKSPTSPSGSDSPARHARASGRVASIQAKLRSSFSAGGGGTGTDSFRRGWGGALNLADIDDLSSSESSHGGGNNSDEDSFGPDAFGDMADMGADMDASENFRAKVRQSMSFNMSFMRVGEEEDDDDSNNLMDASAKFHSMSVGARRKQRVSGRGSIFVIPDEKFGQTKIVQRRLEKAANRIQRFLRRSLWILRKYNEERIYLQNEIRDAESRRVDELADIAQFTQEEKEQFKMELEQEMSEGLWTQEEWDAHNKEVADLKEKIAMYKKDNETLQQDCKELTRENTQLEIVNPEQEAERARLEKEVKKLEMDMDYWERIKAHHMKTSAEAFMNNETLLEKRKEKRAERKKIEKTIKKIIKLLEERHQDTATPKLVDRVKRLKAKREKKMEKLKARTALEVQEGRGIDVGGFAEQQQTEVKPKKERGKSKKQQDDDLPELADIEQKKESSTKKQRDDDLPELADIGQKKESKPKKQHDDDLRELADIGQKNESKPKKQQDDVLPELAGIGQRKESKPQEGHDDDLPGLSHMSANRKQEPAFQSEAKDEVEKERKKLEKKKKKEKKQKEKEKETQKEKERKPRQTLAGGTLAGGEGALMMLYEAAQQKGDEEKKKKNVGVKKKTSAEEESDLDSDDDADGKPQTTMTGGGGALMALFG